MMRYIALSDVHLNITRRFNDTVSALEQIYTIIDKDKIDKVFILGDVFTSRRPHSIELAEFEKWVKKVTALQQVQHLYILRGNHDEYPNGVHSFHTFEILQTPKVTVLENPAIIDNFFLGHMLLRDAKIGTYAYEDGITAKELIAKYPNCHAYLLGDVHGYQVLNENPLVVYAGSIEHTDFAERLDDKGVLKIGMIDEQMNSWEFIKLNTRPMVQWDIYYDKIQPVIFPEDVRDAIVKIIYHGTSTQLAEANVMKLKKQLEGVVKELLIEYNVEQEVISRDKTMTEAINPINALEKYIKNLDLSEEEKTDLMRLGKELINVCNKE